MAALLSHRQTLILSNNCCLSYDIFMQFPVVPVVGVIGKDIKSRLSRLV